MRVRFSFAAGAWAAATATASLISWAGVQIVTSAVTPSPVAVVPSSQIRPVAPPAAPGPPVTAAVSAVPATGAGEAAPSTLPAPPVTAPPPSAASVAAQQTAPAPTRTAPVAQPVTGPGDNGTTTVTTPPNSPPSTASATASPEPTTSTTTPPTTSSGSVREYSTPGGNAEVACNGSVISLVSASPADGYQMYVTEDGPQQAEVNFVDLQYEDSISATCVNGQPSGQTSERSHYGGLNNSPSSDSTTSSPTTGSTSSSSTPSSTG